tara:strand:+ start:837 stop:1046 length:210 start_codon:yes stop_codon:yes gene_type:complete
MPGYGLPKLLYAYSSARIYATPDRGVALFWRGKPVALFPDLETAVDYIEAEFDGPFAKQDSEQVPPWEI